MTALAVLVSLLLAPPPPENPATKLVGRWRLDTERADDAREKMRQANRARRPAGFGPDGRGGATGGRPVGGVPIGGFPQVRDHAPDETADPLRAFFDPPPSLTVTEAADLLSIDDGQGVVIRIRPEGRSTKAANGAAEVRGRWRGDELVVETKLRGGSKLTSAYLATADGGELHVTSTFEPPSEGPVTVHGVYAAAAADVPTKK
jgi:hypothetical protein